MFVFFLQAAVQYEVKVLRVNSSKNNERIWLVFPSPDDREKQLFVGKKKFPICYLAPTFVVEEPLHFHGGPGVSNAQDGAGHNPLLGRGSVGGPHQTPVWFVVESL